MKNSKKLIVLLLVLLIIGIVYFFFKIWFSFPNNLTEDQSTVTIPQVVSSIGTSTIHTATSSSTITKNSSPQTSLYTDTANGFTILLPSNWAIDKNPGYGLTVSFMSPSIPYPAITVRSNNTDLDLDDYVNSLLADLQAVPAYSLISKMKETSGDKTYYVLMLNLNTPNFVVENEQLVMINGKGKAFTVTGGCPALAWSSCKTDIENSLSSFNSI